MKIAVIGAGALGGYYGARLCQAGHETHFLLRSDHDAVQAHGVRVLSPEGDFHVRPHVARTPEEIGPADLVLIGLKTTANPLFPKLIPPVTGPETAVLTLQNGLGNEEALAAFLPREQVLGGLCFVCINRIEPGVIQHIAHGRIVFGEYGRPAVDRTHFLARTFREAGIPCDVTDRLDEAHWQKLVWNVPFNGYGVASAAGLDALREGPGQPVLRSHPNLTTDLLLAHPDWAGMVRELMLEVIAIARALGHSLTEADADLQIQRTREMGAYRASTLVDFEEGRELELGSLFLEPLRHARECGIATPRLEALCRVLTALDRLRD